MVVRERTNALHADPVQLEPGFAGVALVVIDLGWTRQRHALPAAMRWLRAAAPLGVVSLIKPHYEVDRAELARSGERGVLPDELAQRRLVERGQPASRPRAPAGTHPGDDRADRWPQGRGRAA